jgi:hypothetical protein
MSLKKYTPYVVAAFFIAAAIAFSINNRRRFNRQIYNEITSAGLRDDRYHDALRTYFEDANASNARKVCIDPPFRNDCVNVVLVKPASAVSNQGRDLTPLLKDLRLNALALRPNLVLVDATLLDFLTVQVFNDFVATVERASIDGRTGVTQADSFKTALIQASYRQFGNITEFFHPGTFDGAEPIWKDADQSFRNLDELADSRSDSGEPSKDDIRDMSRYYISAVYSLLFEHEFAHLTAKRGTFFAFSVQSALGQAAAPLIYEEEKRADEVALSRVKSIVQKMESRPSNKNGRPYLDNPLLRNMPFLAYSDFLTDLALYEGLEGFRGLPAKDLALSFVHVPCRRDLDIRSDLYWSTSAMQDYFNAVERVRFGERKRLPLLTADEFSGLRTKLVHAELAQTHQHNLVRADQIRTALSGTNIENLAIPHQSDYVQSLLSNHPNLAFPDKSIFVPIAGTDLNGLLGASKSFITMQPAVTCPLERCFVGLMSDGDGYVEIVGSRNEVAEMRFVFNLRPIWAQHAKGINEDKAADTYVKNLVMMLNFFAFLRSDKKTSEKTMLGAAFLRDSIFQCGLGSAGFVENGILYRSQSLSTPGWIEITVSAE